MLVGGELCLESLGAPWPSGRQLKLWAGIWSSREGVLLGVGCTSLHSYHLSIKVPLSPHPRQHLLSFVFFVLFIVE